MTISGVIPQLRTTDLDESIDFYVKKMGFELEFRYSDFYAGIRVGDQSFHLKLVDHKDPSIDFVAGEDHLHLYFPTENAEAESARLKKLDVTFRSELTDTPWQTREFYVLDNQGHVLCVSQGL